MDVGEVIKKLDTLDYTQAENFLNEQIKLAESEKDFLAVISLINELIGFCRDTCQHKKNEQNIANLLEILTKENLQGTQAYATSLLNIANARRAAGKLQESLLDYQNVKNIYEKLQIKDQYLYASLYNNMALLYQEMSAFKSACSSLEKALEIIEKLPDASIEAATTYTNLAQSWLRLGQIEEAEKHLQQAFAIFQEDGNRDYHYSAALSVYAEIKYLSKEYEQSAQYYEKAMDEFKKHMGEGGNYDILKENRDRALRMAGKAENVLKVEPFEGKGLKLCEMYYETYGIPMLYEKFPEYEKEIAVGMVGEGSDCFGYDDETSRDHDWGPGFCMWLPENLYVKIGQQLQASYDELPKEFMGFKRNVTAEGMERTGVFSVSGFYQKILGADFCQDYIDWKNIPEEAFATAVNGKVFKDDSGAFTAVRKAIQSYFPEDIWKDKLGRVLIEAAKTGQYNLPRMIKRQDKVTAAIYLGKYMEQILHILFLLNRTFAPYEKWLLKSAADLPKLAEITDILKAVADMEPQDERIAMTIEIIAQLLIEEMKRQQLIFVRENDKDPYFLETYGRMLLAGEEEKMNIKHDDLMNELILTEWQAFNKVENEGGRAGCQDDWNTFSIMRKSQYMEWTEEMLASYLHDFREAAAKGWNLITEKYGRMMESTSPKQYETLKDKLPLLSERKKAIIEEIVKIQVDFMEALAKDYPKVAGTARSIHTDEDNEWNTSYETYLRGELGTYSDETLSLYGQFIVDFVNRKENLAVHIMTNTAYLYGYSSLDELESRLD